MVPISDDNDLLILSDDESDNGEALVIDENSVGSENNTIIDNDITSVEDELITFDDTQDSSLKIQLDNTNTPELPLDNSETSVLSFDNDASNESMDLSENNINTENTQVESIEAKKEDDFSFGVTNSSHVGTMEEILTKTMDELSLRADSIDNEIEVEKNKIDDLNQQIKILEVYVQEGNDKVLKHTSEKTSILKNLKSIERMRNSNQIDEDATTSKRK